MTQHAPRGEEDNAEAEKNKQQPKQEELQAQASKHAQFVPLGESKINEASIVDANRGNAKRKFKAPNIEIGWPIGNDFGCLNGLQVRFAASRADPQLEGTVAACLKEEDRVVLSVFR
jgi:hypothetical protein